MSAHWSLCEMNSAYRKSRPQRTSPPVSASHLPVQTLRKSDVWGWKMLVGPEPALEKRGKQAALESSAFLRLFPVPSLGTIPSQDLYTPFCSCSAVVAWKCMSSPMFEVPESSLWQVRTTSQRWHSTPAQVTSAKRLVWWKALPSFTLTRKPLFLPIVHNWVLTVLGHLFL